MITNVLPRFCYETQCGIHNLSCVCLRICLRCGAVPERTDPGCLLWSDASTGGSGSAERCDGLASARSARRLPAASPCDAAAVITREPKWLVTVKAELHLFE